MHDEPSALPHISKGQLRSARALSQRKNRVEYGEFLAEGAQAVREALAADAVQCLIVGPGDHDEFIEPALAADVPVVFAYADEFKRLSDTVTPQGIMAVCAADERGLDDIDADAKLVVICAQIRDPGNAGTVIRCADAFGADAVIVTSDSVDVTNPKTVRASVGSIFHLPIITDVSFDDALAWAKNRGLQTWAADTGGTTLDQLSGHQLAQPTAWVMGNEAWGLPAEQAQACDQIVAIPMWGQAESLNLSTAAAVCLYTSAHAQRASS